jgi:hypothetical protein
LYWSMRPSTSAARLVMSGRSITPNLKAYMLIFLMDLEENFFLGCTARWVWTTMLIAKWSLKSPATLQLATRLSATREITRSSVCPSVCVGPSACWTHPNDPISEQNSSGVLLLFFLIVRVRKKWADLSFHNADLTPVS